MRSKSQSAHAQKIVSECDAIPLRRAIAKHCHRNLKISRHRGHKHLVEARLTSQNKQRSFCQPTSSKTQSHAADNMASTLLGYIIRHERRLQNLTQSQLTAALQFGASALSTIENGALSQISSVLFASCDTFNSMLQKSLLLSAPNSLFTRCIRNFAAKKLLSTITSLTELRKQYINGRHALRKNIQTRRMNSTSHYGTHREILHSG